FPRVRSRRHRGVRVGGHGRGRREPERLLAAPGRRVRARHPRVGSQEGPGLEGQDSEAWPSRAAGGALSRTDPACEHARPWIPRAPLLRITGARSALGRAVSARWALGRAVSARWALGRAASARWAPGRAVSARWARSEEHT